MSTQLSKSYDPAAVEREIKTLWNDRRAFHAEPTDPGKPYSIVIPPPNVTAALHLGHALNNTLQDILIRAHRMMGDNTVWLPGTDHAGIATQTVVEKRVLKEEGKKRVDFHRDEFVAKIQAWKDEYEKRITDQLIAMGCSCDFERQAFTMDEPRAKAVREAFFQLFKDGLIYRGKRLVNWDPATQTALADDEVEMEEVDGFFYYLKYPIVDDTAGISPHPALSQSTGRGSRGAGTLPCDTGVSPVPSTWQSAKGPHPALSQSTGRGGRTSGASSKTDDATSSPGTPAGGISGVISGSQNATPSPGTPDFGELSRAGEGGGEGLHYLTVATTRPETMLGDTAVAINPRDPRAAGLRGKFVRLPIVNRIIPIIEDDYVVLPDATSDDAKAKFATGFLKVTPAHDPNDYEIGQRHKLPVINVLAPDGSISDKHGWSDKGDADFVIGLDRYEAREAIVEWFRQNKLLEEVKPYRHSVGHSYRSHVAIEPYLSDQWYCKVTDPSLAGAALAAMSPDQRDAAPSPGTPGGRSSGEISNIERQTPSPGTPGEGGGEGSSTSDTNLTEERPLTPTLPQSTGRGSLHFYPARYAKTFQTWHENIRDWCISRQLWWGHRIPVWSRVTSIEVTNKSGSLQQSVLGVEIEKLIADSAPLPHLDSEHTRVQQSSVMLTDGRRAAISYFCVAPGHPEIERDLEQQRFVQDPDVLDTWFSSALWPMSTLGWASVTEVTLPADSSRTNQQSPASDQSPVSDQSPLSVWNPTSVLCTAREIITLWVSRMVMFNLYFLNRLPFNDVFIHAMIQDGEGRKMSKSLGNGVDPLDIIESHGTDAMRFTLSSMATNTQDVRMPVEKDEKSGKNTSPKFDLGRNFCNKLWNASRFVLMSIDNLKSEPVDELKWSMADRWIVSRFNRTVVECDEALKNYRFDQYAKACYDFFWRDFCDWYVEASKPAMKDPNRAAQTANILAATLDGSLRLLHPLVPFITEQIWQRLCEVRRERGLPGRIMGCTSDILIKAAWPRAGDFAEAAEHVWPRIQEVIAVIRNVRNEYKVDPKKPISVIIKTSGDSARQLLAHQPEIELLATCKLLAVGEQVIAPANSTVAGAAGCEIYLEGLVDKAAEQQRNSKRRDELVRQITAMKGRLANAGYIAKAPPHLVKQTQDQLAEAEAELAKLG